MNKLSGSTKIVILGGGFGGVYTAMGLQKALRRRGDVHVTLVSRDNYFLMSPLLFEAGSGVLEPRHAVNPIRPLLKTVRFVEADVTGVDFDKRAICAKPAQNEEYEIEYDHLVVALGGTTNLSLVPGSEHARTFKTLGDAITLRNHAIQQFELADVEQDPARKAAMLTFVVIGGGLVGVELVGELTEFLKNVVKFYPRVREEEIRYYILDAGKRLAKEFDESLSGYATEVLSGRGVSVRTETKVERIEPGAVHLPGGETIKADTVILCAGVAPAPVTAGFPLEKDRHGRLVTGADMRCKGRDDVWALGDCAAIPDPQGKPYPQLAQHALREARLLARNIAAALGGKPTQPFVYSSKGTLAALGHFQGIGVVMGVKIKGFVAWWVWRSYYLMQMPQFQRKVRVVLDWTLSLLFRNDVVKLDVKPDAPDAEPVPAGVGGGSAPAVVRETVA